MRKETLFTVLLPFMFLNVFAQKTPLPPFLKWQTNNSADCKNVSLTKDSITLAVKNKCMSEGILANWRPSISLNEEQLHFSVSAGAMIQLTITYKFKPAGTDVLSFYGSYDPESDNSDIAFSRNLQMKSNEKNLPASNTYTTATLLINFGAESDNPLWKAPSALKGSMNFNLNITSDGGETHQGSTAIIKDVKLEIIK